MSSTCERNGIDFHSIWPSSILKSSSQYISMISPPVKVEHFSVSAEGQGIQLVSMSPMKHLGINKDYVLSGHYMTLLADWRTCRRDQSLLKASSGRHWSCSFTKTKWKKNVKLTSVHILESMIYVVCASCGPFCWQTGNINSAPWSAPLSYNGMVSISATHSSSYSAAYYKSKKFVMSPLHTYFVWTCRAYHQSLLNNLVSHYSRMTQHCYMREGFLAWYFPQPWSQDLIFQHAHLAQSSNFEAHCSPFQNEWGKWLSTG